MNLKPAFRWVGGKRKLTERILREISARPPALFVEPFVGAGAITLAVATQYPQARLVLNDANETLMGLWQALTFAPRLLHLRTRWLEHQFTHTEEGFAGARETYNILQATHRDLDRGLWFNTTTAAFALYLLAHTYNGLWRVNQTGNFNAPFGGAQQAKFRYPTEAHLQALSALLRGRVDLHAGDFEDVLAGLGGYIHSVEDQAITVYADPPYVGGFDQYTASGFDDADQRRLARVLENLAARGARIITSNADAPLIHEIYDWARIELIDEARRVAAAPTKRRPAPCVLIQYP